MKTMTSRERLLAATRRQPVDRVPCSPRMWAWLLWQYGEGGLSQHLRAAEEFGFDLHMQWSGFEHAASQNCATDLGLSGVTGTSAESEEDGFRVVRRVFRTPDGELTDVTKFPPAGHPEYGISPNPIRSEYLVKSPDDLGRLRHLIPAEPRAELKYFFGLEEQLGDKGLALCQIMSPLCHKAGDAYSMSDLMIAFYEDRVFFDALLDMYQRETMAEVQFCLAGGIKNFFANWYYNSMSAGWSPRIWQEVFGPQLAEMVSAVHKAGGTVNLYDDGKVMPILELLADTGIDVLQTLTPPPVGDVDLAETKRRIGKRVCLMGYVDLFYVLRRGTPALIDETVRKAIEIAAPGGGFILGTSDSIRDGTPVDNVKAYFEAARKYGGARSK